jgi:TadE-like protein
VINFWHEKAGSALIEYAVVFPLFISVTLGTVDVTYMLFDWALANKAAYVGARTAVVSDPVAQGITDPFPAGQNPNIGQLCFNPTTGAPNTDSNGNNYCPTVSSVCTGASGGGSCTNGKTFDNTAFSAILGKMQAVFPRLQRQNVQISYQTNGLGFVLQPGGLPMDVTVSVQNMTHQFYFINAIARIISTPSIPKFATTLTSEDMATN